MLNERRQRFVNQFLIAADGKEAAIRAGFSPKIAAKRACKLLRDPDVRAALNQAITERAERVRVDADQVLSELVLVGFSDICGAFDDAGRLLPLAEMSEAMRRAIQYVEVEDIFEGRGEERVRVGTRTRIFLFNKIRALEALGKHLRLFFTDRHEHQVDPRFFGHRLRDARARAIAGRRA